MSDHAERCELCRYFELHAGESDILSDLVDGLGLGPEGVDGRCRRYPPSPKWLGVGREDWCGEFRSGGGGVPA